MGKAGESEEAGGKTENERLGPGRATCGGSGNALAERSATGWKINFISFQTLWHRMNRTGGGARYHPCLPFNILTHHFHPPFPSIILTHHPHPSPRPIILTHHPHPPSSSIITTYHPSSIIHHPSSIIHPACSASLAFSFLSTRASPCFLRFYSSLLSLLILEFSIPSNAYACICLWQIGASIDIRKGWKFQD